MPTSGPIRDVSIDGRNFPVDGENAVNFAQSGYTNENKQNGDGVTSRLVKSVKAGRANSVPLIMDNDRDDEQFIQDVMDKNGYVPILFTDVNGVAWSSSGQIVEDPETDFKEGIKEVNLSGNYKKQ